MLLLFCSDPFDASVPHPMWSEEMSVASKEGEVYLLDHDELVSGNIKWALRKIPLSEKDENEKIIYHGWMLTPKDYFNLYEGLIDKGYQLINTPKQYLACHHLANWVKLLKGFTPKTEIVSANIEDAVKVLPTFGTSSLVIKDFVSSQKHNWHEACFIPDASDTTQARKIISKFFELQNEVDGIQGGIVLREFIPLRSIGNHPKSGMPLSQEFRAFVLNGKVVSNSKYWEYGNYSNDLPPEKFLQKIVKIISEHSNFFTIDLAQTSSGDWVCIEVGDGQVSSLPDLADKVSFYKNLYSRE